jgi:hypothetical protein
VIQDWYEIQALAGSGKRVRLILDWDATAPDARPEGWLIHFDEVEGEAQLGVGDDPEDVTVYNCWPVLAAEILEEA